MPRPDASAFWKTIRDLRGVWGLSWSAANPGVLTVRISRGSKVPKLPSEWQGYRIERKQVKLVHERIWLLSNQSWLVPRESFAGESKGR